MKHLKNNNKKEIQIRIEKNEEAGHFVNHEN